VIGASDHNLGMVGMVLAAKETAARYETMATQVAPVRARVRDLDFRRDFRDALRRSFKAHELPGAQNATTAAEEMVRRAGTSRSEIVSTLQAASAGQPMLILWTSYKFEPYRYAWLIVTTHIELYDPNASSPRFEAIVSYESVPVASDRTYYGWPTAIKRWEENGGAAYRAAYREAITETMTLLRLTLVDRPAAVREGKPARELGGDKYREILIDQTGMHSYPRLLRYSTMQEQFPRPAPGSARIYFYRTANDPFPFFQPAIRMGNRTAGVLGRETFFFVDAAPGAYEVSLQYSKGGFLDDTNESLAQRYGNLKLKLQPGETAYVRMFSSGGTLVGEQRIEQRPREQAEPELAGLPPADGMYSEYVIRGRLLANKLIR